MPQLHLYVPAKVAEKIKKKAKARKVTVSRYLAAIVSREVNQEWPRGYFERVSGKWSGVFPEIKREEPEELLKGL